MFRVFTSLHSAAACTISKVSGSEAHLRICEPEIGCRRVETLMRRLSRLQIRESS